MANDQLSGPLIVQAGKFLVVLIILKVGTALLLEDGLTLTGAAISALVLSALEEFAFAYAARRAKSPLFNKGPGKLLFLGTYGAFFVVSVPLVIILAIGFSPATVEFGDRYNTGNWFPPLALILLVLCLAAGLTRYRALLTDYRVPGR